MVQVLSFQYLKLKIGPPGRLFFPSWTRHLFLLILSSFSIFRMHALARGKKTSGEFTIMSVVLRTNQSEEVLVSKVVLCVTITDHQQIKVWRFNFFSITKCVSVPKLFPISLCVFLTMKRYRNIILLLKFDYLLQQPLASWSLSYWVCSHMANSETLVFCDDHVDPIWMQQRSSL